MHREQLPKLLIILVCVGSAVAVNQTNSKFTSRTFSLLPTRITIEFYFGSTTLTGQATSDQLIDPSSGFVATNPSFFITHGWLSAVTNLWVQSLKDAVLTKFPTANVFLVDWSPLSVKLLYAEAKLNTVYVGKRIAEFIQANNIDPARIHFIGHSFGSHVAGVAGYQYNVLTGNKLARITGLDPATPLYSNLLTPMTDKLDKSDATFVDTIFTSMAIFPDILGIDYSIGHVNFFPNGGDSQPGCIDEISLDISSYTTQLWSPCSHARAIYLFQDSILYGNLVGYKCTYSNLLNGLCQSTTSNLLGYPANAANPGDFVLTTGATSPFANDDYNLVATVNSIDVPLGTTAGTLWITLSSSRRIDLASPLIPIASGKTIRKFAPVSANVISQGNTVSSFWYTLSLFTTGNLKATMTLSTPDNTKTYSLGNPATLRNGLVTALLVL